MDKHLIKANAKDVLSRTKRDNGDFSVSPDIDNSGRGVLKIRNVAWELNDKYVASGDLNYQRIENGGFTNAEEARLQFSVTQAIYHPTEFVDETFFSPVSWSSSVSIVMPEGSVAGKTITGNDGQQYIEMRDSITGDVNILLGQSSCMMANSDVFDPLKRTTQSLRDEADHFEINYKIGADGKAVPRTENEKAFKETMVDFDNRATKLPNQLDMITIITNDVVAANNPKFQSAANPNIKTPVAPAANFSDTAPVKSVVLKPEAKPASWVAPTAQNDDLLKLELKA